MYSVCICVLVLDALTEQTAIKRTQSDAIISATLHQQLTNGVNI